ncbi:MAG: hypothetical protein FK732_09660 [Asgard group archaeon]|nr:hypothetical protein [Asgard group archaeon]
MVLELIEPRISKGVVEGLRMKVPIPNAFTVNQLRSSKAFFPFCASLGIDENGIASFSLFPQDLQTIEHLIMKYFKDICIAFSLEGYGGENMPTRTVEFAQIQEIKYRKILDDLIMFKKDELKRFLYELSHFNFHLFDSNKEISEEQAKDIERLHTEYDKGNSKIVLLKSLEFSDHFIDSHDDCYLIAESRNIEFLKDIFAQALQIFCGSFIHKKIRKKYDIASVSEEIFNLVLPVGEDVTILEQNTELDGETVKIYYSKRFYDFHTPINQYRLAGRIDYNYKIREWNHVLCKSKPKQRKISGVEKLRNLIGRNIPGRKK